MEREGATIPTRLSRIIGGFVMLVIPPAIVLLGLWIPIASGLASWLLILALLSIFIFLAGYIINGRVLGFLIDGRNQMTLARLQMIVWTILLISAFLAEALIRTRVDPQNATAISVPEQLWLALGISVTSLVGSPLIRNSKKDRAPSPEEKATGTVERNKKRLAAQDNLPPEDIQNIGRVVVKRAPKQASLSDMFKGDEISDCSQLDLGKIQMFYFTLVLVLAYGVQLGFLFHAGSTFDAMPELDTSMVALLGISHAGYLANKATP